jgi:hypothetical protein
MRSHAGWAGYGGRVVGGLVGWMVMKAIASDYYCGTHGLVHKRDLPHEHQSVVTTRKIILLLGAGALLVFVVGLVCLIGALQSY